MVSCCCSPSVSVFPTVTAHGRTVFPFRLVTISNVFSAYLGRSYATRSGFKVEINFMEVVSEDLKCGIIHSVNRDPLPSTTATSAALQLCTGYSRRLTCWQTIYLALINYINNVGLLSNLDINNLWHFCTSWYYKYLYARCFFFLFESQRPWVNLSHTNSIHFITIKAIVVMERLCTLCMSIHSWLILGRSHNSCSGLISADPIISQASTWLWEHGVAAFWQRSWMRHQFSIGQNTDSFSCCYTHLSWN